MNTKTKSFIAPTITLLALAVPGLAQAQAQTPAYQNPKAPLETRVADLMSRLTDDEKISLLAGTDFTTKPIPRLGVPPLAMADAGQGVRGGSEFDPRPGDRFSLWRGDGFDVESRFDWPRRRADRHRGAEQR